MTNDLENIEAQDTSDEALTSGQKFAVFTTGILIGAGATIGGKLVLKKFRDRQAEKNAEEEN